MQRSERFQPRDEIGIVTPLGGVQVPFDLRFCFCYSLAFGLQIKGEVLFVVFTLACPSQ
ncbi:MAG TPA: hypothetical protein VGY91_03425 [Chthoniobacterales bacterium]|nr:hypothetical protein [Chthoniobacterales bacterium]